MNDTLTLTVPRTVAEKLAAGQDLSSADFLAVAAGAFNAVHGIVPQPEPVAQRVRDRDGDRWVRQTDGTFTLVHSDGEEAVSSSYRNIPHEELTRRYGPLEVIR